MKNSKKVLIVGAGGREQAMAFKLAQSREVNLVYLCPDPKTPFPSDKIRGLNVDPNDFKGLGDFSSRENVDLVVIGPEVPLVKGLTDFLERKGLSVLGPSLKASQLEGSKHFSKSLMQKFDIPTALFKNVSSYEEGLSYLDEIDKQDFHMGVVLKADKLAAGKGVFLCDTKEEAKKFLFKLMNDETFVIKDDRVVIEEKLFGRELSAFALCDGESFLTIGFARDYKRLGERDNGPNTGGMGGFSYNDLVSDDLRAYIEKEVFSKTLKALKSSGIHYKGILFAGLMVDPSGEVNVLEFNVRMGDPETQILLPLINEDLYPLFKAAADGELGQLIKKRPFPLKKQVSVKEESSVHVVMVSEGYPLLEKGKRMTLERPVQMPPFNLFHKDPTYLFFSGLKKEDGGDRLLNNGGRVLGVTCLGRNLKEARERAYEGIKKIHFDGAYYRGDIALDL